MLNVMLLPLQGDICFDYFTQGVALGWGLVALSGRYHFTAFLNLRTARW